MLLSNVMGYTLTRQLRIRSQSRNQSAEYHVQAHWCFLRRIVDERRCHDWEGRCSQKLILQPGISLSHSRSIDDIKTFLKSLSHRHNYQRKMTTQNHSRGIVFLQPYCEHLDSVSDDCTLHCRITICLLPNEIKSMFLIQVY
jgi:hypothetical protein